MPSYTYVARDGAGRSVTGVLSGADERAVRDQLRRQSLWVTRLQTRGEKLPGGAGASPFARKVKLYEMVVFSRQLSTLVRAGLNVNAALDALREQTRNETMREAIETMQTDIGGGSTMTAAMRRHPKLFGELYTSLVEAGELGGMLDQTLDVVATALDTEMEIREKVKSAFVYPIAVICVAIGVVTFLLMFVVPVFANVYKNFHADLPAITQSLVTMSDILRQFWWVGVVVPAATSFFLTRYNKTHKGRRVLDGLKIKLPLFGALVSKIGLSRACHTLAALSDAGVPLMRGLSTAGRVSGNSLVMDALEDVSRRIEQGESLGIAMTETKRFPLLMCRMIAAGETTGNLGEMLEQIGKFFDREVDFGVKRLMTLIEPILTVGLGVVVGFILIALYYPIFNLSNVVK